MTGAAPPEQQTDPIAPLAGEFAAEGVYLNTATLGLPPRRALDALAVAVEEWRTGQVDAVAYDRPLEAARAAYAAFVDVPTPQVAVGSQASAFAGLVAAALPDGAEVLVPIGEFTSILFPFLAQAGRGVVVREVPLERIADAVTPRTTLVSLSAVQSSDGRVADLAAVAAAADAAGARVLLDTTQATGWLPVDAGRFAYTVNGGYKWLLAARGTCFATVRPEAAETLTPHLGGWYAGADRWSSIYGGPLRLADDARRFDVSPAWLSWVTQAPALDLLTEAGREALHVHATGLATRVRTALGLPAPDGPPSAILSLAVAEGAAEELARAGVRASTRAGRLRLSFHVHNDVDDADRVAEVLTGLTR